MNKTVVGGVQVAIPASSCPTASVPPAPAQKAPCICN